jgi:hypothetical protein
MDKMLRTTIVGVAGGKRLGSSRRQGKTPAQIPFAHDTEPPVVADN